MFSLVGKTAIVTGAGRGIGFVIAKQLHDLGAFVVVNDLKFDEQPAHACKDGHLFMDGDITREGMADMLVKTAWEATHSLDIIVNNAGYSWDSVIQKTTDEQFRAMLDIHLVAPFRMLRAAQPYFKEQYMKEKELGRFVTRKVVNVSSIAGTDGNAGQAGYSSGKAGVIGLTRTLAKEFGRYAVTVNAVAFGLIETRMTQPILDDKNKPTIEVAGKKLPVGVQPALLEAVKKQCPLGRLGKPEDAANGVLFFCSPLSDYATGEVLTISGGFHL